MMNWYVYLLFRLILEHVYLCINVLLKCSTWSMKVVESFLTYAVVLVRLMSKHSSSSFPNILSSSSFVKGTIALTLHNEVSKSAPNLNGQNLPQFIGIEVIPEAVESAYENARLNGIEGVRFITGKAEVVLPNLLRNLEDDVEVYAIVDPPRSGLREFMILLIWYLFNDNMMITRTIFHFNFSISEYFNISSPNVFYSFQILQFAVLS